VSGIPNVRVMTVLIIAAVILGIAAGYWLFLALT
jgi:hypothetical protein